MKRLLALLFVLTLIASLCSCSTEEIKTPAKKSYEGEYILTSWTDSDGNDVLRSFNAESIMPYRLVIDKNGDGELSYIGTKNTSSIKCDGEESEAQLDIDGTVMDASLTLKNGVLTLSGEYNGADTTAVFREPLTESPFSSGDAYSKIKWTNDNRDAISRQGEDMFVYWTNRSYVTPYNLVFNDDSSGSIKDYTGSSYFTEFTFDYKDMTMTYKQGDDDEQDGFITVNDDIVTLYKVEVARTEVFQKQPLDHYAQLLGSKKTVTGKMVSMTGSIRDGDEVTLIDYTDEYMEENDYIKPDTFQINDDGTGKIIYETGKVWRDITYNADDMSCVVGSTNGYSTIDGKTISLYMPADGYSYCLTYVIE